MHLARRQPRKLLVVSKLSLKLKLRKRRKNTSRKNT